MNYLFVYSMQTVVKSIVVVILWLTVLKTEKSASCDKNRTEI